MLLEWRNDPDTRRNSHSTDEVNLADHVRWVEGTLKNPNRTLWVAELGGLPVGTVRADRDESGCELSWTVAPAARGKGIGKRMVAAAARQTSGPLRAEVKTGNVASARIAEAAGMRLESEREGVLYFGLSD